MTKYEYKLTTVRGDKRNSVGNLPILMNEWMNVYLFIF